ncbi:MAG: hypothetical protein ABR502_09720 [Chitinophagaceae bacterium]
MEKILLILATAIFLLSACNNYGKKVIVNSTSEVFYKGDGVTGADAKRLGKFLLRQGYFDTTTEKSVQLSKENNQYVVKFVVSQEKLTQNKDYVLLGFKVWQMWISQNVFNNAKTKVVLTDENLKDVQEVGEFTAEEKETLKQLENSAEDSSAEKQKSTESNDQ